MPDTPIDFSTVTACGECCIGCTKKADGLCQGCIESDGHCKEWTQSGGCPIHRCAKEHGVQFCGLCREFPCADLTRKIFWHPHVIQELQDLADSYHQQNT